MATQSIYPTTEVLGLHLERDGAFLRLQDPATGQRLLTSWESLSVTEAALRRAEAERLLLAEALHAAKAAQMAAEADRERMQRELEELRRKLEAVG